jgi:hypothetical protein
MGDVPQRMQFSERIGWLIQRNTRTGGAGVVHRLKVEEIGADLGMSKIAAYERFSPYRAVCGTYTPVAGPLVWPHPPKRTVWSPIGGG